MGISLYLDGTLSNPKSIAKACQIAEGGGYMRDYVEDERGRIARVDFDFVKDKWQKKRAARNEMMIQSPDVHNAFGQQNDTPNIRRMRKY